MINYKGGNLKNDLEELKEHEDIKSGKKKREDPAKLLKEEEIKKMNNDEVMKNFINLYKDN